MSARLTCKKRGKGIFHPRLNERHFNKHVKAFFLSLPPLLPPPSPPFHSTQLSPSPPACLPLIYVRNSSRRRRRRTNTLTRWACELPPFVKGLSSPPKSLNSRKRKEKEEIFAASHRSWYHSLTLLGVVVGIVLSQSSSSSSSSSSQQSPPLCQQLRSTRPNSGNVCKQKAAAGCQEERVRPSSHPR